MLVIDDDATFRELAAEMLRGWGISVVGEADTVATASLAAKKLRPAAALVDVMLPDGSGVTLASELAALPWHPRVVLTSSDSASITDAIAQSAGVTGFIAKDELPDKRLAELLTGRDQPE